MGFSFRGDFCRSIPFVNKVAYRQIATLQKQCSSGSSIRDDHHQDPMDSVPWIVDISHGPLEPHQFLGDMSLIVVHEDLVRDVPHFRLNFPEISDTERQKLTTVLIGGQRCRFVRFMRFNQRSYLLQYYLPSESAFCKSTLPCPICGMIKPSSDDMHQVVTFRQNRRQNSTVPRQ